MFKNLVMHMSHPLRLVLTSCILVPLLAACGAAATAQEEPTPTPLPPAPAIERPTYVVERGVVENPLEIGGRVTPINLQQLSFRRSGVVERLSIERGTQVKAGDVLAELRQDDERDALRLAQDNLVQAQRDLDSAKKEQQSKIEQAELNLQDARDALQRVLPGGAEDPIRVAQEALEAAQRDAETQGAAGSEGKTNAEYTLVKLTEALSDTQRLVSDAFWAWDHAQRYGTDPKQPYTEEVGADGKVIRKPNYLTDEQKAAYEKAYIDAQRQLRDAERNLALGERDLDKQREAEIVGNEQSNEKVQEAQRVLDELVSGRGNKELIAAQRAVKEAQLALVEAQAATLNVATKAVENAQRELEKAQKKVDDGLIIASMDGEVITSSISEGDTVEADSPVFEIADTSQLEVGSELTGEQMRQLQEGQPVEITLLSRPDVVMPAVIRQMPAPYGSGGSGTVESRDRRTLFEISDLKGQELKSGQNVKIRIVLERKEDVLWLPPEAIRSFEGRRFVLIRTDKGETRQTVRVGIETEERVEVVEGVSEGDVIVGQ